MKRILSLPIVALLAFVPTATVHSAEGSKEKAPGILLFADDFNREDASKTADGIGNGWGTNSKSRAGGNKQVEIKNGAMYITMHPSADHAVSVTHEAAFENGVVELRFMLEDPKDSLGVDFADLQFKDVHAGHLFKVNVTTAKVDIDDSKSGGMNMKFYEAKKAKTLPAEDQKFIASKKKGFPVKLDAGNWYSLGIQVMGDQVSVAIDGKEVGSFASEGFAHPTKRLIRLGVPKKAVVDDVKFFSITKK